MNTNARTYRGNMQRRTRCRETEFQRFRRVTRKRFFRFLHKNFATVAAVILLAAGIAIGAFGATKVSNYAQSVKLNDYGRHQTFTTYTVKSGDTIWGIAADLAALNPEYNDIRQYVAEIEKLNKLYNGHIEAGQTILIPYFIGPNGEVSHDEIYSKYGIGQ